jgi:CRP/FNR family cyclic AMP-dependent transcriptional regulator
MDNISAIKQIDIFQGLTEEEYDAICSLSKTKVVKKNTLVFSKGDENHSIYILIEGSVDVFILTESGKELILSTLTDGDYFGELSLLDGDPISANIMAITDCVLIGIHKDDFFQIMKRNPALMSNVISHLCSKVRELTEKVEGFALMDVYQRFSLLLMELSDLGENGERVVNRTLTHKNIALHIGSSREMVSRIIKDLESGEYISVDNKVITIKKKLPMAW